MLLAADGLALSEVVAPNRVVGDLDAYGWALFVAAHEARHTAQIEEIAATLQAPPGDLPRA